MILREYSNLYIDGRWHEAQSTDVLDVISPPVGRAHRLAAGGVEADIDAAVEAAHKAFYETNGPSAGSPSARSSAARSPRRSTNPRRTSPSSSSTRWAATTTLADVYQSTAPTLHRNYYAEVGEDYDFSEVRMADLSRLGSGAEGGSVIPYAGQSLAGPGGYLIPNTISIDPSMELPSDVVEDAQQAPTPV
jgi:aldehyde dehydrogenase (NAD+)